ncbi:hypothetical protein ANCCAN_22154 [Ancylostoma caninum]|uniref:SXP/RAL-2 family protein Ani s 5-like cation-binding domain-containing protein n=1 Tax=Ancylostoma caninum TaxID=29170 RepID=A0A368FMJ0_ANCCA|nr:hypothetical protein ANCCAN_22154 [Ancylostoma caninum]
MKKLILLFIVPAIFAFKAKFQYGCGSESCTYKFIIPEVVAHYVDPKVLKEEVGKLQESIEILKRLQTDMPGQVDTAAFDQAFTKKHKAAAEAVEKVTEVANKEKDEFVNALNKSVKAKTLAECLAKQAECFESEKYSDDCGKLCDY